MVHVLICDPKILRKCSEPSLYRQCTQNRSLASLQTEQMNCVGNSWEKGVMDIDFQGLVRQLTPTTE